MGGKNNRFFFNGKNLKYENISLSKERLLIAEAQKGSIQSKDELILRHINFLTGRIRKIVFSDYLKRFGKDLFSEGILILYAKIYDYDLTYRNKQGEPKPVRFRTYIWKRIDGFIIDYLKKETIYTEYFENYDYEKSLP